VIPTFPEVKGLASVQTGDMPGDSVQITEVHLEKARQVFPSLWAALAPALGRGERAVVAVHGGSGVGKSEIGSLLAHALSANGVGAYVLSGDNYPHRVPSANDAERLRVFRAAGMRAIVASGEYDASVRAVLGELQGAGADADPAQAAIYPWLGTYLTAATAALAGYLGTPAEIAFDELSAILAAFHDGADHLTLKRMGRTPDQVWYDDVDVTNVRVLVLEWTHGNSDHLRGVDVPVLLNSTPAETLAHRRARNRDGGVDSPFTTLVLGIEQEKLHAQTRPGTIIVAKSGEVWDYDTYLDEMGYGVDAGPMLNAYPDSMGGTLADLVHVLGRPELAGAFTSAYLLPSVFNTDLDRGFSVIDYELSEQYATRADLDALARAGIALKLDFILNHASVLSPQFQDLLARGQDSEYADFFIDWNEFWSGHGEMTDAGYVQPAPALIQDMFFRKPGLPILMVRMPNGTQKPYWNTFYQEVRYPVPDAQDVMAATGIQYGRAHVLAGRIGDALAAGGKPQDVDYDGFEDVRDAVVDLVESRRHYLGQMDLNIRSEKVWEFYADTFDRLAGYGARIVRLDAFAYAPKAPGERNFLNDPGTWDLLADVKQLADARGVRLLPEIHSTYGERVHEQIAARGFMTYDFFLPGLLIDALERKDAATLARWVREVMEKEIRTVTMLGCHDGIPLLDLRGLLDDERIETLIARVKGRGGYVKDLHGATNVYYQVNATYYSALGESDAKMLLARAIHLFVPGKPQVWYLDLFAGTNDHAAVDAAGPGGHKEINRTNLTLAEVEERLTAPVVVRQLQLLRFRASFPAFGFDAQCDVDDSEPGRLRISWTKDGAAAVLDADLVAEEFTISASDPDGTRRTI
jgi:glycosidase